MTIFYRVLTVLALVLMSINLTAQTNSVELKSGTGAFISAHNSIATAFAAIPVPMTQAYVIELTSAYLGTNETYPISFSANAGASSVNTLTLRPATGITSVTVGAANAGGTTFQLSDADYVIIDGRPGGEGAVKALTIQNTAGTSSSTVLTLANGATNNVIKYCNIIGVFASSNSTRGIFIGTSASNASGNSFNRIEHCFFSGSRNLINSNGTAASPNTRNTIFGCTLENPGFAGIWLQSGTGYLTLDSNYIYSLTPTTNTSTGIFGLVSDAQLDTLIITRNHIHSINAGSGSIAVKGINLRSFNANGTTYSLIANNIIVLDSDNSNSSLVTGIDFGSVGSNPSTIDVFYNSVQISGVASAGTAGNVASAALHKAASGALNLNIKNNLFVNTRSGAAGAQHLSFSLLNTTGTFSTDYNCYSSTSGDLVRLGGLVYNTFASYQAAAGVGNDLNSNDFNPTFVSATDLRLQPAMAANVNLQGTLLAAVNIDIQNTARAYPYRGAHELSLISCSGQPTAGTINATAPAICLGDSTELSLSGQSTGGGLTFQWISRPATGGSFTAVPGATATSYRANSLTTSTEFRCVISCDSSSLSDTTATITIIVNQQPLVTSIGYSSVERTYTFTAVGATDVNSYLWTFGDGNSSTDASPVHTYPANGNFNVTLIYSNACSEDTLQTNLSVTVGIPVLKGGERELLLFPNPTRDELNLRLNTTTFGIKNLEIYDLTGRLMLSETLDFAVDKAKTVAVHTLPAGNYLVRLGDKNSLEFHRLVIVR